MHPLNIVIINDFAHINGGAALVALTSASALAQRGHKVFVMAAVKPILPELEGDNPKLVLTDQHQIVNDPNRLRAFRQGLWNKTAANKMRNLLTGLDPRRTIIHFHGWTKSLSSSVTREAISAGFPTICTLHEFFLACPNGGFFNYKKNKICHLRPLSPSCIMSRCDKAGYFQKMWRVARQLIQRRIGQIPNRFDSFIAISDFSRTIMEPYLPLTAKIYDVANPIFVEQTKPARPDRNVNYIAVGRLTPEKGFALLAEAGRSAQLPLLFVGDGQERLILEQNYPDIKITGWLSREEVMKRIRSSRTLVLPSLWYETQGLVVLEAAAQGIPAIIPDSSAARDYVIDGETGLWFKGGNTNDLARQMRKLSDPNIIKRMGRAAYDKFWSNPPTLDRHVIELEKVYHQVLADKITSPLE